MRLAILAASSYAHSQKLTRLTQVEAELDVLGQRLTEPDAGFTVHIFSAERGLAEGIEQLAQTLKEPIEALFFYFCGYAVASDERGPALLLDGERLSSLSLKRLRRLLNQLAPSSLAVLDTVGAFENEPLPRDVVRSQAEALTGDDSTIQLLAANRPKNANLSARSPFTALLELVLDWQSSPEGLSAAALFAAMRSEESLFAELPAAEYFPGPNPFHLLTPGYTPIFSVPAPAGPGFGDSPEQRGDAQAAAGNHDAALFEYNAALEQLGPPPSREHAPLYVKIGTALRASARQKDALAYFEAALAIDERGLAALRGASELHAEAGDSDSALKLLERWL
ncbi:MAG TPA: hypothetical protein VGP93_08325, partial [Polyangiaceae bacterium]|nr:hypothetical protein [Polyangiaceae bacterium]